MDKYQTVRFDRNRYSVPRACAYRAVTVKGYIDRIEVVDGQVVQRGTAAATAVTSRCSTRCTTWRALERRPAALEHAPVLRDWQLPESFARLRPGAGGTPRPDGEGAALHPRLAAVGRAPAGAGAGSGRGLPRRDELHAERIGAWAGRLAGSAGAGPAAK